jgi:Protein of unknown function (DUF982)
MEKLSFDHVPIKSWRTGQIVVVSNAPDALASLEHWPSCTGDNYAIACDACRKSINGELSADSVRRAFVEAAQEAQIIVLEQTGAQLIEIAIAHKISSHKPNEQP